MKESDDLDHVAALQALADTPYCLGSHDRDELSPGLRSYHLIYSRQQAKQTHGTVKSPRHIVFYRVANDALRSACNATSERSRFSIRRSLTRSAAGTITTCSKGLGQAHNKPEF